MLFSGIGAELLDQFYGDGLFTSHWLAAIAAAVSTAARQSAGRPRTAHPRNRRGHRWTGVAGFAAARARPAFLHVHRCLGGILSRRARKSWPRFRKSSSRFSISKNRAWSRSSKRRRSTSSSAPTCCTRSAMCAPPCGICMICWRRAAASFSWTRRRRNFGPRRSSV